MKLSSIFAVLTLSASVMAAPASLQEKRANIPGLDAVQTAHAYDIIAEVKAFKFAGYASQACRAAMATALVEVRPSIPTSSSKSSRLIQTIQSEIRIYANSKVKDSLKYAHDSVGSNFDSIGIL